MSVTRCFDEIEFLDMALLETKGRSRAITVPEDKEDLFNRIEDVLRNPAIANFYMKDDLKLPVRGGMTALSEYTMIEENAYPTYIVPKKELSKYNILNEQMAKKRGRSRLCSSGSWLCDSI